MVVEQINIEDEKEKIYQNVNPEEIDALVSTIEVHNMDTIVSFGAEVAEEISKTSDAVLNSMGMKQLNDSGELLTALTKIMDQFDIDEIKEKKGLFGFLKKKIEDILAKYHTMGEDVDKIYVQLKGYESEIKKSNKKLATMFEANVDYYQELVKYILAGDEACKEINQYITELQAKLDETGDQSLQFEITSMNQALQMMEQRTFDLRIAENVAMQTIPMLKTMEYTNYNLVRKINSAFIVTLPVFKQALAQAIMLKRQKIQAESLSALDKKTNELLLKNAQNNMEIAKKTAQMSSGSAIQIETLEATWRTITTGIEEVRTIEADTRKRRVEDQARLENIKAEFNKKYRMPKRQ
ncbi:MAG: toxic anion resistance protein [Lachnospiraceae bacterium]|nr:toxic anion resistance protein [Lachnospiraceae bacterium]